MILITRPKLAASYTQQKLELLGFRAFICSALSVRYCHIDIRDGVDYDGIILTSMNAALALAAQDRLKNKLVLAVGGKTAAWAREVGFRSVVHASGDADSLIELIKMYPPYYKFLYVCGNYITKDLTNAPSLRHYDIKKITGYKSAIIANLAPEIIDKINRDSQHIMLYSLRSAQAFRLWTIQYNIDTTQKNAICISRKVASGLDTNKWQNILYAASPDEQSMFSLIT